MIRFVRRWKYTIALVLLFAALTAYLIWGPGGYPPDWHWWDAFEIGAAVFFGSLGAEEVRKRRK